MDRWIITPPKTQDIKYNADRREYKLQYIYSEDGGRTVEIMTLQTRNNLSLYKRIETLREEAKKARVQGLPVTNWMFGGDHVK